jgi:hypothetical protein
MMHSAFLAEVMAISTPAEKMPDHMQGVWCQVDEFHDQQRYEYLQKTLNDGKFCSYPDFIGSIYITEHSYFKQEAECVFDKVDKFGDNGLITHAICSNQEDNKEGEPWGESLMFEYDKSIGKLIVSEMEEQ